MPQLNPAPWFTTLISMWLTFLLLLFMSFLISPYIYPRQNPFKLPPRRFYSPWKPAPLKTVIWTWPW
uniref:ATP synthase complex subunit 8 n=1 Tax=Stenodactylus petrii TaxID=401535 RepID=A0A0A1H7J9_9SAUR|nr:ATPase subunit 8 [Stenodactylus petrii]